MKRLLLFSVLAIAIFLFAGCPGGGETPIPSEEEATISVGGWSAEVEPTPEEETEEEEIMEAAVEERDTSYCLKLPANERDACVLPLSNDSLANCIQLTRYENKRGCLFHHAYATENASICDLMSEEDRAECLEHLSPPCTFVLEPEKKARCMAFEYLNYSYCRDESCYMDYAFEHEEEGACNQLAFPKKEGCLSALDRQDRCSELDLAYKHLCYYIYALGEDQPTRCYYINGIYDSELALQCFTHFAIKDSNPDLCEAVLVTKRWDCYTEYALETGDKNGCYDIDERAPASREDCFEQYAYAYDDLSSCMEIETTQVQQICYSALIFGAEDLELSECNGITLPEWKDKCYQEYAKLSNDETYCNYIEGTATKQNCYNMFQ